MNTETKHDKWRPFHKTIVKAIRGARSGADLKILATLIKTTKIPENHNEIAAAWDDQLKSLRQRNDFGVLDSLMDQKMLAEEKTAREEQVGEVVEDLIKHLEDIRLHGYGFVRVM